MKDLNTAFVYLFVFLIIQCEFLPSTRMITVMMLKI